MHLNAEQAFFESHLQEWLKHHEGKFALIKDEELAGFFDSAAVAYAEGVLRWGNVPFLIKQVLAEDTIEKVPALVYGLIHAAV